MKRASPKKPHASAGLRRIFLFVLGSTPQVVTETLWWFQKRHTPPVAADEVVILTTSLGAKEVARSLKGKNGKLAEFCRSYGLKVPELSVVLLHDAKKKPLADIRTTEDNHAVGNQILEWVARRAADPGAVLHFSIAGGRRTLALHLACAAMFHARENDTLSHVLAAFDRPEKEKSFFPPPGDPGRGLDLAFLPILRLRDHAHPSFSLDESVIAFQKRLDRGLTLPRVKLDLSERTIMAGETVIRLPHQQIALWAVYALSSDSGLSLAELMARGEAYFSYLERTGAQGEATELGAAWKKNMEKGDAYDEILEGRLLQLRSKMTRTMTGALADPYLDSFLNVTPVKGSGRPQKYGVRLGRKRIDITQ